MYGALVDLLPCSAIDIILPINLSIPAGNDDRYQGPCSNYVRCQSCLLVIRGDTIEVYARRERIESTTMTLAEHHSSLSRASPSLSSSSIPTTAAIILLARQRLATRILEADRLPPPSLDSGVHGRQPLTHDDKLLLAFANHHYAILSWDAGLREWRTYSLHSFGHKTLVSDQGAMAGVTFDPLITDAPRATPLMTTPADVEASSGPGRRLVVDPEGRCALLKTSTAWALLPLATEVDSTIHGHHPGGRSRLIESLDERIRHILDMSFLPGYMEPTLAILYEPHPTWPYRLPLTKDTVCLLILSLDMDVDSPLGMSTRTGRPGSNNNVTGGLTRQQVRTTAISQYSGIASDARSLYAADSLGIFLAGANTLVHIDPGNPTVAALALNSYVTSRMAGLKRNVALRLTMERPYWFSRSSEHGEDGSRLGREREKRTTKSGHSKPRSTMRAATFSEPPHGRTDHHRLLVVADDGRLYECSIVQEKASSATAAGRRIDLKPHTNASISSLPPIKLICRFAEDAICVVPPTGDAIIYLEHREGRDGSGGGEGSASSHDPSHQGRNSHQSHQLRPPTNTGDPPISSRDEAGRVAVPENGGYQDNGDDEDEDIYGERIKTDTTMLLETTTTGSTTIGHLTVLAPLTDLCISGQIPTVTSTVADPSPRLEIALALGNADTGQVVLCRNHLPMRASALFTISASQAVYGLDGHRYLVATENSIVLVQATPGTPVRELSPGAILPVRTLLASTIERGAGTGVGVGDGEHGGKLLIQVTSASIRMLSADVTQLVAEIQLASYSPAREAKLAGPLLFVHHEDGLITAYDLEGMGAVVNLGNKLVATVAFWDVLNCSTGQIILVTIDQRGILSWIQLRGEKSGGEDHHQHRQVTKNGMDVEDSIHTTSGPWTVLSHEILSHARALPIYLSSEANDQSASFEFEDTNVGGIDGISLLQNEWGELFLVLASRTTGLVAYQMMTSSWQPPDLPLLFKRLVLPPHVLANYAGRGSIKLHRSRLSGTDKSIVLAHTLPSPSPTWGAGAGSGSASAMRTWLLSTDQLGSLTVSSVHLPGVSHILSVSRDELGIYDGHSGSYQVFAIEEGWRHDAHHWPHRRVPLPAGCTRSIAYHSPSNTLAVISAQARPFPVLPRDEYTTIADNEMLSLPTDALPPQQPMHKLLLLRNGSVIDSYGLGEDELVLCLTSATLETKQTASGRQPFLVLGTSVCRGEDRPARGRVLVFDVISVVAEEGHPEATDCRLKLLASEEMKGPVTAVTHIGGALAVALGSKVIIHAFERNESLTGVAFIDAGVYGTTLSSLRSFFALGDVSKSVALFAYQERPPKVVSLARDYASRPVLACEWLVEGAGGEAALVTGDAMGVIRLYSYDPMAAGSEGGMRLLNLGSLCTGDDIMRLRRIVLAQGTGEMSGNVDGEERSQRRPGGVVGNHACLVIGASGAVRVLCPVDEGVFRRLYGLQLRLATSLPHLGGVTGRAAWQHQPVLSRPDPLPRTFLDGNCLLRLHELPPAAQGHLLSLVRLSRETGHALIGALVTGLYSLF